jgi:DNA-directed RNA polymerase subunit omega
VARITVEDCLQNIDNRFDLVVTAARRARQIANGAQPLVNAESDKPTVVALREIAQGLVTEQLLAEVAEQERLAREQEAIRRAAQEFDADLSKGDDD